MEYNVRDAYEIQVVQSVALREAPLLAGQTVLHVAATHAAGGFMFTRLCEANQIIDPIPFDQMPPRYMRRGIVLTGQTLGIPDDAM